MRLKAWIPSTVLACALAIGCGSGDGTTSGQPNGGGSDADGGAVDQSSPPDLGKKLPGPCSTTLIVGEKSSPDYMRYKYDSKGRKVDEHTWADADKHTFTHTWTWNAAGQLAAEKYETSGPEPNFDYQMSYAGDGKLNKKTGSTSSYVEVDCIYEYGAKGGKLSLEQCSRTWELKDDEGEVTGTDSDKYLVLYTHGDTLITEEYGRLNFSSPDKTVWKSFDSKGRLVKLEFDYSTRGYAEERTIYTWDEADNLLTEVWDFNADDTPEATTTHHYDKYGNRLRTVVTHTSTLLASTIDPKKLESEPHELIHVFDCSGK